MRLSRAISTVSAAGAAVLLVAMAVPVGAGSPPPGLATYPTAGVYTFTVPAGVVGVTADLSGAGGGAGLHVVSAEQVPLAGALGGRVVAAFSTTPGANLDVVVGGAGGDGNASGTGGAPGYNGGGAASTGSGNWSGGGGGATDIRTGSALTDRVLVAGGGGGTGGGRIEAGAGGSGVALPAMPEPPSPRTRATGRTAAVAVMGPRPGGVRPAQAARRRVGRASSASAEAAAATEAGEAAGAGTAVAVAVGGTTHSQVRGTTALAAAGAAATVLRSAPTTCAAAARLARPTAARSSGG